MNPETKGRLGLIRELLASSGHRARRLGEIATAIVAFRDSSTTEGKDPTALASALAEVVDQVLARQRDLQRLARELAGEEGNATEEGVTSGSHAEA